MSDEKPSQEQVTQERLARGMDVSVPQIYFNGFVSTMSSGDVLTVLERNGKPVVVLNMSYTVAKTLAISLGQLVSSNSNPALKEIYWQRMMWTVRLRAYKPQRRRRKKRNNECHILQQFVGGVCVRPSPTLAKIGSFASLPVGWDYGQGVPASVTTVSLARDLYYELTQLGFTRTEAFPGTDGAIQLTAYEGDLQHIIVIVRPSGEISLTHKINGLRTGPSIVAADRNMATIKTRLRKNSAW
jgi:hypothetical protein